MIALTPMELFDYIMAVGLAVICLLFIYGLFFGE